ncbi:major facilitator superfamily domain-containing protein [Apiospora arundinis]|uniref:Major facilitator superfamily domain-containing protein n=1 Tax=Apiospora arundinis TaxID=335852 RepID=A0ABR2ITK4_9PEZI
MDSPMFGALVHVEESAPAFPAAPKRAVSRTYHAKPQQQGDDIELQTTRPRSHRNHSSGPIPRPIDSRDGKAVPAPISNAGDMVDDGGRSGPPSSPPTSPTSISDGSNGAAAGGVDAVEAMQSLSDPPMNRYRMMSICLMQLLGGLNDAAPGALIPYMEKHYNIGYAVVSLIFIGNALGFIMAAPFIDKIRAWLGRAKTLALSQVLMACGYIPMVCTAPFPLVVISFFFIGFGYAMSLAIGNVFCGNLRHGTAMLGAMHGSYGIGGTVGPIIATTIVTVGHTIWSRYYFLTLSLAVVNLFFATWAFWAYERDDVSALPVTTATTTPTVATPAPAVDSSSAMFAAFKSKVVVLGALFIFAYQGAEVSISGWVISFLMTERPSSGVDPSSIGYVTAGFWAGITLGRFLLSPLASRVGLSEKTFVYVLVAGSAVFEALVWWVPNVIGESVALAVVGLLLGPVYPCAASVFTKSLSRREQVSGLGVISAFGSSGGAVAPFTTGMLAQVAGTFVLHPIAIALFAAMTVCWYGIPAVRKRTE